MVDGKRAKPDRDLYLNGGAVVVVVVVLSRVE